MSGLHVYAVFDETSGDLVAISASIGGAGVEAIRHVGSGFVQDDGSPVDLESLVAFLAVEPEAYLRTSIQAEPLIRIERRLLGP
jgi:hypothetical protein